MFLTSQLVFTIFMLAAEKHKATFIAPVGIGLSLFIAQLAGQSPTLCPSGNGHADTRIFDRRVLYWWFGESCTDVGALCRLTFILPLPLGKLTVITVIYVPG